MSAPAVAKFEEGKPADPTVNMTDEQKKVWWEHHDRNKDKFKAAAVGLRSLVGGQERASNLLRLVRASTSPESFAARAREAMYSKGAIDYCLKHLAAEESDSEAKYEEGKPADPTENMSAEDAAEWKRQHDKHEDNFKEAAGGLYGYTKSTQRDVEAAVRRIERQAAKIAEEIWNRDEKVAAFLTAHARRASSMPARILSAALKDAQPKGNARDVTAGPPDYSLYGFRARTARLGLNACTALREFTGRTAYDLHTRRQAHYGHITGFLKEHTKAAKCRYSRLLLDSYPDAPEGFKVASEPQKVASVPTTVAGWLAWED